MPLKDVLKAEVGRIFTNQWDTSQGRKVPVIDTTTSPGFTFKNVGSYIDATVLYADLADSTLLVNEKPKWFAAEIYKAFLFCAGKLVLDESGEITAYDGDRVMAVFMGADRHDRAVRCAQKVDWAVLNILQPALDSYLDLRFQGYRLKHVVGVDDSSLLVTKIGVRNNSDLVWVGRAANYAAKLASEDDAYCTYITAAVYQQMTDRVRLVGGKGVDLWQAWLSDKIPEDVPLVYRSNSYWEIDVRP